MKKEKVKGRAAAILGMVALMVLSVPVGAVSTFTRESHKALETYEGSSNATGILEDLANASGEAADLVTLAKKYLSADESHINAVQRARAALDEADSPAAKAEALSTLTAAFNALSDVLLETELSEKDKMYLNGFMADYNASLDYISRSAYNDSAAEFNAMLEESPLRPIASLVGIDELELFR